MAEETVNAAIKVGGLAFVKCRTRNIAIHGYTRANSNADLSIYGSDEKLIKLLILKDPELGGKLTDELPYLKAEVIWAARYEQARTVEDILARRLRLLFLNARAAIALAPKVAFLLAKEFGRGREWEEEQVKEFNKVASGYLPPV
jgi:glycerol-3-phosphate dehydrogenase